MYAKTLAAVVIVCLTITTTASPVMALQHQGPATSALRSVVADGVTAARSARTGDIAALERLLDQAAPRLAPVAQSRLDALREACRAYDVRSDIKTFLRYAGSVLLLIGIIAIVGGIQLVITGTDISEGLISIMLGIFFTLLGLSMLAEAGRPDPA